MDFLHHRIVVVVPAYNEERFIGSVVLKIRKYPVTVIVVDDGSTDDTAYVAQAAGAIVARHEKNQGKGDALNTGFCQARQLEPEAIVIIDGDGQHLPEQLPHLVQPVLAGQADLVVGSRYLRKDCRVPRTRLIGHWFFNQLARHASGVGVSDSQSGFRAFSPRAYNADLFHCSDFSVESEMQFLAREYGLRVAEVPITIRYEGPPKRPALQQGLVVLNGILHMVGQYRPLFFFGVPGAAFLLTGLGWGLWVVELFMQTKQLAIGHAFIFVLLFLTGQAMLSTGFILHSVRGLLHDMLRGRVKPNGG
ncbi:MAG TPA: glycosyltransferase family 2 protein [Anaerolineales bacterium]